jgi:hypothetical protein
LGFWVSGFQVFGFGFRVLGFGFGGWGLVVSGFGFRVSGLGFRVCETQNGVGFIDVRTEFVMICMK